MEYTAEHLEQLLDLASYSINIKDSNDRYKYVNKQFEEFVKRVKGRDTYEIIGKTQKEVWGNQDKYNTGLCVLGKNDKKIYMNSVEIQGKHITIETQSSPVKDKEGNIRGQVELLEILERNSPLDKILSNRYEGIARIYKVLKSKKELEYKEIELETIIDELFRSLKCDYLNIYRYDNQNKKMIRFITRLLGTDIDLGNNEINTNEKEVNDFYNSKEMKFLANISRINVREKYKKILSEAEIEYIGIYPIKVKGQLWGSLSIGYKGVMDRPYLKNIYMKNLFEKIIWVIKNHFLINDLLEELSLGEEVNHTLDLFFDSATDFLCILDEKGKIKRINHIWMKYLGYTRETIKGKSICEMIYKEDVEAFGKRMEESIERGVDINNISRYNMASGEQRWVALKGEWAIVDGRKIAIGVGKDVNQEKLAEERRRKLRKTLEREKHKNLFFSTLSHEFKTPLNIILSITQLLEQSIETDAPLNEEYKIGRYIDIINRNAYQTLKVANNLIDLIKMDTRTEKLDYKYYNIVEVIEEITIEVAKFIQSKKLTITFDTDIEEKVVWCHEESIERIMLNLLSNAIKYSPEDGKILVYIKNYPQCIGIYVEDEGRGISSQDDEPIDTGRIIWKNSTSGLGLKIVDQLVSLHQGKLIIENIKTTGTRVIFTIPMVEDKCNEDYTHRGDLSDRHRESCKKELCDI